MLMFLLRLDPTEWHAFLGARRSPDEYRNELFPKNEFFESHDGQVRSWWLNGRIGPTHGKLEKLLGKLIYCNTSESN